MKLPETRSGGIVAHVRIWVYCILLILPALPLKSFAEDCLLREMRFNAVIYAAAARHSLDPLLVKAVIWKESKFRPAVKGSKGEAGLMQIRPCVAADWAKANGKPLPTSEDLFDPYLNLEIGSWYLSQACRRWEHTRAAVGMALWEYNAGPGYVQKAFSHSRNPEHLIAESPSAAYIHDIREKYLEYIICSAQKIAAN